VKVNGGQALNMDGNCFHALLARYRLAVEEDTPQFVFEHEGVRYPFDRIYAKYLLEFAFSRLHPEARRDYNIREICLIADGKLADAKTAWHARKDPANDLD
jgi:hypothetical protein